MATRSENFAQGRDWSHSLLEWGILACVILILMGIFGIYAHRIKGQAERAEILSTLGALRTALIIDHLRMQTPSGQGDVAAGTPFDALQNPIPNWGGVVKQRDVTQTTPGQWVFDQECSCIGYKPLHAEWLEAPSGSQALWFRLKHVAGIAQLQAMEAYVWQGLPVD